MGSKIWLHLGVLCLCWFSVKPNDDTIKRLNKLEAALKRFDKLETALSDVSRQLMLQQLFVEERIRSEGQSGIKHRRLNQQGSKPYHGTTYSGNTVASIHDHANNVRTVGLGEFIAVLNGVEFRTRHNDYKLVKPRTAPSANSSIPYDAVEEIEFPEVPPEVTSKANVDEQVAEMREWFKAWKSNNYMTRDFRKYFKPILCYLEGTWTNSNPKTLDESFDSDRHHIDASSWLDLQEKIRFTSYTGRKNSEENFAYLPTTITKVVDGQPILAQWNYRILCHPLSKHLPVRRLTLVDDLHARIAFSRTIQSYEESRAARFKVAPEDKDFWQDRARNYDLLDELMSEIPGKDGYGTVLLDEGIGNKAATKYKNTAENLNAGYYHRWLKASKDAMGTSTQHRGFADESLFMAATTQNKVAHMEVEYCKRRKCQTTKQAWTYAIPLEIIYLTPLQKWNPYGINYKGKIKPATDGSDGRSKETPLDGSSYRTFYQTPLSFFTSSDNTGDKADTSGGFLWVNDTNGTPQQVTASGVKVHLPDIPGIGKLRLRYPIMPVHQEGSAVWKELDALKDMVIKPDLLPYMFYNVSQLPKEAEAFEMTVKPSQSDKIEQHTHKFMMTWDDMINLRANASLRLEYTTDEVLGHAHTIRIRSGNRGSFFIQQCDRFDKPSTTCWDKHKKFISVLKELRT